MTDYNEPISDAGHVVGDGLVQRIRDLEAELARVIEDRARFPDRPDDIGRMIEAHIGNLKAGKEAADGHAIRAMNDRQQIAAKLADAVGVLGEAQRYGLPADLYKRVTILLTSIEETNND